MPKATIFNKVFSLLADWRANGLASRSIPLGTPAADYNKTTDSKNHFFYQMAAAYPRRRRSGGAGVGRILFLSIQM